MEICGHMDTCHSLAIMIIKEIVNCSVAGRLSAMYRKYIGDGYATDYFLMYSMNSDQNISILYKVRCCTVAVQMVWQSL